jgi:hypothetical protein
MHRCRSCPLSSDSFPESVSSVSHHMRHTQFLPRASPLRRSLHLVSPEAGVRSNGIYLLQPRILGPGPHRLLKGESLDVDKPGVPEVPNHGFAGCRWLSYHRPLYQQPTAVRFEIATIPIVVMALVTSSIYADRCGVVLGTDPSSQWVTIPSSQCSI